MKYGFMMYKLVLDRSSALNCPRLSTGWVFLVPISNFPLNPNYASSLLLGIYNVLAPLHNLALIVLAKPYD